MKIASLMDLRNIFGVISVKMNLLEILDVSEQQDVLIEVIMIN